MRRLASTPALTPRLPPCGGGQGRAGRGGRATAAAGRVSVSPSLRRDDGRVVRVTPSAMPVALGSAWRVGAAERGRRDPLSAPETLRRGAERGPLPAAERLTRLPGAESSASAATSKWTTKRLAGRGAGRNFTCERTAQ